MRENILCRGLHLLTEGHQPGLLDHSRSKQGMVGHGSLAAEHV